MAKLRVGIFSFTGDEGCVITFLEILNTKFFEWVEKVDFVNVRVLQKKVSLENLDIAFVEGAISNEKEVAKLLEIRKNSKKLIAIGSCAISGAPSNHRNLFDEKTKAEIMPILVQFHHREKVVPLSNLVIVDDQVPGCPIIEEKFIETMEKYVAELGGKP